MRNPLETISFCSKFILLIFLFFILLFRLKFPFLIFFIFKILNFSDIFNVYLHKSASILDTRHCAENYMYVLNPSQFRRLNFNFETLSAVEQFWTELQAVCTSTPLNRRSYTSQDAVFIRRFESWCNFFYSKFKRFLF